MKGQENAEEYAEKIRVADEFVSIVIEHQKDDFRHALQMAMQKTQTKEELTYEIDPQFL